MKPLAVVALSLSLLSFSPSTPVVNSIQPLYLDDQPGCTAFSVNEREKLWVTAGHCTMLENKTFGLGSATSKATVIRRADGDLDMALMRGEIGAPALDLASKPPTAGQDSSFVGFPLGTPQPLQFFGRVSSPSYVFPDETLPYTVFDSTGLMGASGAPVLVNGDVVSLLNGIYRGKVGEVAFGPTWGQLRDFVGPIWK